MEFRLLRADEIECRISTVKKPEKENKGGLTLLLYKDARVDQNLLDETVGAMNWQRSHQLIGDRLYCTISIWDDEKKQWISKQDVGTESYTEKEKGQASDSFKRAAFNFGIGRELYTAPFIWVSANKVNIQKKGEKVFTYDKFRLTDITYNESREIVGLVIVNQDSKVVYSSQERYDSKPISKSVSQKIENEKSQKINKELARTGVALDTVLQRYGVKSVDEMTDDTYRIAINSLRKTKDKVV